MKVRVENNLMLFMLAILFLSFLTLLSCGFIQKDETPAQAEPERPPPKGETLETGHWLPVPPDTPNEKTWWRRTAPIKYDKNGIPKNIPTDEDGNSYLTRDNFPPHLRKKYDAVEVDGNTPHSNPSYYQEIYDALCSELTPKEAAKFFIAYNEYNAVAVKHMDDYQALKYILRTTEGDKSIADASEYAQRLFEKQPKTQQGYEAGMYLRRYAEVINYHPKDTNALDLYALQFYSQQNHGEALKYFTIASKYNNQAIRRYRMSICNEFLKNNEKALFHIKQAHKLAPKNENYILNYICLETGRKWNEKDLGLIEAYNAYTLAAHDQIEHAIDHMVEAIRHDPHETLWKQKLRELVAKRDNP